MDRVSCMISFVKVVENGGFSPAARKLDIATSVVTTHVKWLEDRLGVRLLNRTTRNVSLTEAGQEYYERCVQILSEIDDETHDRAGLVRQAADSEPADFDQTRKFRRRMHEEPAVMRGDEGAIVGDEARERNLRRRGVEQLPGELRFAGARRAADQHRMRADQHRRGVDG